MTNTVNWQNPYARREGRWLRGNLHTHTTGSDGDTAPAQMAEIYARAGYDFLAISDHMAYTSTTLPGLTLLPGMEWNAPSGGEHTGIYGKALAATPAAFSALTSLPALTAALTGDDDLVILNHPNWQYRPHFHREELEQAGEYDGIEIFNGVIKVLEGSEYATDKWDYLLAKGKRVLGVASDDAHSGSSHTGVGWIMVRALDNSAAAIFAAIKAGNFYCSTGVHIHDIRRDGQRIEVDTDDAQEIQVLGDGGQLLQTTHHTYMSFDLPSAERYSYVRCTAYGAGSTMAWTQPFFLR